MASVLGLVLALTRLRPPALVGEMLDFVGDITVPLSLLVAGKPLRAAGIGTVSVHPYARGEGHMKKLMHMTLEECRENGADLAMLGGQRQRYEYFGFTQQEVNKILEDTGTVQYAKQMKEWYDGYHMGEIDVYCPWDVMNYLRELQRNPKAQPVSYWKNTSDNAIIRSFIDYAGSNITKKLETLMAGGCIVQQNGNIAFWWIYSSGY